MIFQTQIIWSTIIHSLKYLRSTTLHGLQSYNDRQILDCDKDSIPLNVNCCFSSRQFYISAIKQKIFAYLSV